MTNCHQRAVEELGGLPVYLLPLEIEEAVHLMVGVVRSNKRIQPTSGSSLRSSPAAADPCR